MNLEAILTEFGLTGRQARLYINCLELGSASAYRLAKKMNIPRSSCYEELDDLKDLGLVSTFRKKKVKYYSAEDPRKFIHGRKEKIRLFEEMLPQFNALYMRTKNRPQIRFYEGLENMKTVFNEVLDDAPPEIISFSSADDLFAHLSEYWDQFLDKRLKKKIPVRIILRDTPKGRERKSLGAKHLRRAKLIPAEFEFNGIIIIWKQKIAMFSFREDYMALLIESRELSQTLKSVWQSLWRFLPD